MSKDKQITFDNKGQSNRISQFDSLYTSFFTNNHSIMLLINPETGDIVDANITACQY